MKKTITHLKQTALLLFTFGILSLTSCDKDDDGGGIGNESDLVGTWLLRNIDGYEISDGEKETFHETYNEDPNRIEELVYVYNEDHSGYRYAVYSYRTESTEFTWQIKNGMLYIYYSANDDFETLGKIKKLSSNTLVLERTEKDKEDRYELYETITYKKADNKIQ
jgi:hypothetical protein